MYILSKDSNLFIQNKFQPVDPKVIKNYVNIIQTVDRIINEQLRNKE